MRWNPAKTSGIPDNVQRVGKQRDLPGALDIAEKIGVALVSEFAVEL